MRRLAPQVAAGEEVEAIREWLLGSGGDLFGMGGDPSEQPLWDRGGPFGTASPFPYPCPGAPAAGGTRLGPAVGAPRGVSNPFKTPKGFFFGVPSVLGGKVKRLGIPPHTP